MGKNKTIVRLLSKILFICLVVNTLPASFSVHAKTLTPRELAALRAEVNREIGKIKKEINALRVVKFAVPGIVLVGGAALTIVGTALAGWLFNKYRKKLANNVIDLIKNKSSLEGNVENVKNEISLILNREKTIFNLKSLWKRTKDWKYYEKGTFYRYVKAMMEEDRSFLHDLNLPKKIEEQFKKGKIKPTDIIDMVNTKYLNPSQITSLKQKMKELTEKISQSSNDIKINSHHKTILTASTIIVPLLTALSGFIVTGLLSGLAFTGFSWVTLYSATKGAKRLEEIEKEIPGALTRGQKDILAEFKKLSGDMAVQGFIKNVRLKETLAETIATALQQNPFLIELLGSEKQARKVFEKYIKLRWEEQLLQKAVDEGARTSSLNKAKRKIEKLVKKLYSKLAKVKPEQAEANFKKLQNTLNSASQVYATQANKILEELRDQVIEAIETGKLKLQKGARVEPIVPLGL